MEAKYKVGDIVTIKKRTFDTNCYRNGFIDEMAKLAGQKFRIEKIRNSTSSPREIDDDGYDYYLDLKDIEMYYTWASSMFEDRSSNTGEFTRNKKRIKFNFNL